MGKNMNRLLSFMRLNDNEYEDDFDDFEEEEETPKKKKSKRKSKSEKKAASAYSSPSYDDDDIDDIPDDDDGFSDEPARERQRSSRFRRSGNIVHMNTLQRPQAMEVRVSRPVDFESCQEISDIILDNKAAIINFEAVTTEEAQRIIDFVSGSCYAIDGTVKQVSDNIVVVTPNDIDITGDFQDNEDSDVNVPEFGDLDFDSDDGE